MQPHDQVTATPAHPAMDGRDRPFVHDPRQKCPVPLVELRRRTWRGDIDQTIRPLLVEPDHPVAKRLPVHPPDPCGPPPPLPPAPGRPPLRAPRRRTPHPPTPPRPFSCPSPRRASRRTSTAVKSVRTT